MASVIRCSGRLAKRFVGERAAAVVVDRWWYPTSCGSGIDSVVPVKRNEALRTVVRHNYRLQRTAERHRVRAASASFHSALAARSNRHHAAAEPGRSATLMLRRGKIGILQ